MCSAKIIRIIWSNICACRRQQYDEETGLHYNRHRYYDPRQGRYITQDPIGLAGGWNLYAYPLDPVMGVDPLRLFAILKPTLGMPNSTQHGLNNNAEKALTKWRAERVSNSNLQSSPCNLPEAEKYSLDIHY